MSDWSKLGSVGIAKTVSSLARGGGEPGMMFAIKIKKVRWEDGKYCMDIIVRTPDLGIVLASKRWDLYPSMLPVELQSAIDCDVYDDSWFILETELNPHSKAGRNRFRLIDTQGGLSGQAGKPVDALPPTSPEQEGPSIDRPLASQGSGRGSLHTSVPADDRASQNRASSDTPTVGGQPQAGEVPPSPAACSHTDCKFIQAGTVPNTEAGFFCKDCGERVG